MTTGRPVPMPPGEELLDALRRNALLLRELSARYGVELQPERPSSAPEIHSWHDVWRLLGEEMAALAQEQLRVLLLDSQNRLAGQRVIYQGSIDSVQARTAEVLRPAIVEAVPKIVLVHNHPSGDPAPSAGGHRRHQGHRPGGGPAGHRTPRPRRHRTEGSRELP